MTHKAQGFTIIEVLVAVIVLTVGVSALVGSAGVVTRMIGQGRRTTRAVEVAERRLENLRQTALATTPQCTGLANGSATQTGGISEVWQITTPVAAPTTRVLRSIITYRNGRGTSVDTLSTSIRCA